MKILIVGFWLALWVSVALADLTVVHTLETSAMPTESGKGSTMTMKMKGQKARIDFSDKLISSIVDLKSKKLFFLDHKQKQVMVMPLEFMQSMLALSAPETATGQDKSVIQKTGKVQAINGYTCEEYAGSSGGGTTIRCWIANASDASEMEPFRVYAQDAFKATSFGGLAAMKGLIVRSESTVLTKDKPVTSRTELQSLSKAPISDAVFSPPADYTVMGMPALPMP
ncbi:MAG: DUF4412 domain-containing protein [Verrucomicrobia bacterium]|nr:DUF4412 domain-containing protein [Verrucomicrobiota bacterium]MBU1734180.1 DUF4412 domain-containing protein [Verrucomicrobiota bacterium]MBU1856516.1 DUF4412 domain-containing protein [Verrucomicrobiota bacterium]